MADNGTISIEVQVERLVRASRAEMHVEIAGSSLYSGASVLEKAREVSELVGALSSIGISEDSIEVLGILASVSSGLIGKSSSVSYRLCVKIPSTEKVADALGAVTKSKNATLGTIIWRYDGMDDIQNEMLREALGKSQQRASIASEGIGQGILGVGSMTEKFHDPEQGRNAPTWGGGEMFRGGHGIALDNVSTEALGLEIAHSKVISLDVRVVYRLCPRES